MSALILGYVHFTQINGNFYRSETALEDCWSINPNSFEGGGGKIGHATQNSARVCTIITLL